MFPSPFNPAPRPSRGTRHPLAHALARFVALRSGGARVGLVAMVSGGKDSMALLGALTEAREDCVEAASSGVGQRPWELAVFHADHGLRGEESAGDARFVAQAALARGLPVQIARWAPPASTPEGMQAAAREWRRAEAVRSSQAFAELWRLAPERVHLLSAHHAQDHVESVLLNLVRGTGLAGLRGLAETSDCGRWWRPFAQIPPADLLEYALQRGIEHREDASNASDDYDRNLLRHQVLPALRQLRPQLEESFLRLSRHVSEALGERPRPTGDGPFARREELRAWILARLEPGLQGPSEAALANLWDHAQRSLREPGRVFVVTAKGLGSVSFKAGVAARVS